MLNKLRSRIQDEKGFTLIELLVVILIIGILAAIALPAFLGQRARAQDTEAKSAVREAQTAAETYYTDNQNYDIDAAKLRDIEASLSSGVSAGSGLSVTSKDVVGTSGPQGYTLEVTSKTGNKFTISKSGAGATAGTVTRTCDRTGGTTKGGCPASNSW
jgi:type IV pilus assembly protein PilA